MAKATVVTSGQIYARVWIDYQPPLMLADALAITDIAVVSPVFNLTLNDPVSVGENVLAGSQPRLGDAITTVDNLLVSYGNIRSFADSTVLDDTAVPILTFGVAPADSVTMGEGMTFAISQALADNVAMSEAATKAAATAFGDNVTMSDGIAKADSIAAADTVTMSDGVTTSSNGFLGHTDVLNIAGGTTSQAISLPGGTRAGDLVVVTAYRSGSGLGVTGGSGGWTVTTTTLGTFKTSYIWKVVDAGDIAGSLNCTNTASGSWALSVLAWRGPTTLAIKSEASSASGSTLAFTGFTKNASSFVIIGNYLERDATAPSWPANWVVDDPEQSVVTGVFIAEIRELSPALYTNGSSITISGFDATTIQSGAILELV